MGAQRRLADMPPITGGTSMTAAAVIQLHPKDFVVIARASLVPGIPVPEGVATAERIPSGHKVAVLPVAPGEPVRRADLLARIPLGRFLEPDEVAAMVSWPCGKECTFSTGAVFDLSGGRTTY